MRFGSYRDLAKWIKVPLDCIKVPLVYRTLLVLVFSWVLWRAIDWALLPGYWQGNLIGGGPTLLDTAKHHFGPILLVHTWISNPSEIWGKLTLQDEGEVLHMWGYYESAARFKLIIAILWVAICVFILVRKNRSAQPCAAPNGSPATQAGNSRLVEGPPLVG